MKARTFGAILGVTAVVVGSMAVINSAEAEPCAKPITITQGGTYTGHWCSADRNPAVTVATSQPVVIDASTVEGYSHLIVDSVPGVDLTVTNSQAKGLWSSDAASNYGRSVFLDNGAKRLVYEHNDITVAAGVKVVNAQPSEVTIRYNRATNILGDGANNAGGGYMQFVQLASVRTAAGEIAWNEVRNTPGKSRTEDVISLFGGTGGTGPNPFRIHDNLIAGSYWLPPENGGPNVNNFSGGGIMVGDQTSSWVVVEGNTVVGTTNYGISIVCGSNNTVRNNRVVAANRLADGTWLASANVGMSMAGPQPWNVGCTTYTGNVMTGNVVGWQRGPNSRWGYGRADSWAPAAGTNGNVYSGNTSLKSGEITPADEQAELVRWDSKVAAAGVVIGRGATPTTTVPPATTVPPTTSTVPPTTTSTTVPPTTTAPTTVPPTTTTTARPCVDIPSLAVRVCPI